MVTKSLRHFIFVAGYLVRSTRAKLPCRTGFSIYTRSNYYWFVWFCSCNLCLYIDFLFPRSSWEKRIETCVTGNLLALWVSSQYNKRVQADEQAIASIKILIFSKYTKFQRKEIQHVQVNLERSIYKYIYAYRET